jgi:hypothetical protein
MPVDEEAIERRILERMQKLWIEDDRNRDMETYREEARLIVATEDTQKTMLKSAEPPRPEPAEIVENLGEFPTLTDQHEGEAFPSRDLIPDT